MTVEVVMLALKVRKGKRRKIVAADIAVRHLPNQWTDVVAQAVMATKRRRLSDDATMASKKDQIPIILIPETSLIR
jgi:hypothetical protein